MIPADQWLKIGKGALIAVAGAALTALEQYVLDTSFGELTGVIVAVNSVLVNVARKWLSNNDVSSN